jgi:hypothetical protein
VLELAVTASLRNQEPPILLQEAKDLGHLHPASIHTRSIPGAGEQAAKAADLPGDGSISAIDTASRARSARDASTGRWSRAVTGDALAACDQRSVQ